LSAKPKNGSPKSREMLPADWGVVCKDTTLLQVAEFLVERNPEARRIHERYAPHDAGIAFDFTQGRATGNDLVWPVAMFASGRSAPIVWRCCEYSTGFSVIV